MTDKLLSFRISTGLKNIIGKDLITDDYVAVFELVKNSFDAHAKKVTITFKPDKIIIKDDGKGMDIIDLKEKWLFLAYSAKKEGIEDAELEKDEFNTYRDTIKLKQYYAGAKGIGRFSCDRLGSKLIFTTKKASDKSKLEQIEVNWKDFENDSKENFLNIKVKHRTLTPFTKEHKELKHGTILEISSLESVWTRRKKIDLKKSLEKLINPIDISQESENNSKDADKQINEIFKIFIIDESELEEDKKAKHLRERINGEVRNFVFETLNLKTTQILTEILEDSIIITIKDRGTLVYKIKKRNDTSPKLSNIKFHLFYLNRAAKANFTRLMNIQPAYFGSIFLYKNGFRVAPYGDFGDDSFGLNIRQAQKFFERFGTRDVIGRIEITADNTHFKEVSNRNGGIVKDVFYDEMLRCFQENCLVKLENYVKKVSWKTKEDSFRSDLSALEQISSKSALLELITAEIQDSNTKLEDIDKNFVNLKTEELLKEAKEKDIENLKYIAEKFGQKPYLEATNQTSNEYERIKELERLLEKAELERLEALEFQRLAEEKAEIERQKNTYLTATRRVLSEDAKGLIHSIKINTIRINKSVGNLIRKVNTKTLRDKDLIKELTNIKFYSDRAFKISKLITRAGFKSDIDKQTVDISKYINQYLSLYSEISDDTLIEFEILDNNSSMYKKISVLELSIVFDDLISNAEKWHAKKIQVELSNTESENLLVLFSDDGDGLLKKYIDRPEQIFELGITETDGSGIGLYNVRKSLREMNAEIKFIGNGLKFKGATFQIIFEK